MLILTRKIGESLLVGEDIRITVIDIQKNQIRIGIEASKEYTILREELVLEIQQENQKAMEIKPEVLDELVKLVHPSKQEKRS